MTERTTSRAVLTWVGASVRAAGWAPAIVVVVHFAMARYLNLYARISSLDSWEHTIGGVAIGYFFWRAFSLASAAEVIGRLTVLGRSIVSIGSVALAAVVWEWSEWVTDRLGLTFAQPTVGDTMLDLLLGIAAGSAFIALASTRERRASR